MYTPRIMQYPGFPFFLDGATGTNLQAAGMPKGVCTELWVLEHPEVIAELQNAYIEAGSGAVYAPTFGANRASLERHGCSMPVEEINARLVEITRSAAAGRALIMGDLSPTGLMPEPYGDTPLSEIRSIYAEQAKALCAAGVDGIVFETMLSLDELAAAVRGVRDVCDLPLTATVTVDASGRTMTGNDAASCLVLMQALGVSAFGLNCSTGPEAMAPLFRQLAPIARIPLIAKPNAGMPREENGVTVFEMDPASFAEKTADMLDCGVSVLGGCCGTTPAHIAALRDACAGRQPVLPAPSGTVYLTGGRSIFVLDTDLPLGDPVAPEDAPDEDGEEALVQVRIDSAGDAAALQEVWMMLTAPVAIVCNDAELFIQTAEALPGTVILSPSCPFNADTRHKIVSRCGCIEFP